RPAHNDGERAATQEDPTHPEQDEEREVGAVAAGAQIAEAEEQLEGQAAAAQLVHAQRSVSSGSISASRPRSGLKWGKRMTTRIEGESVSSMTRRSMPIPSPAAGGMPYSRRA